MLICRRLELLTSMMVVALIIIAMAMTARALESSDDAGLLDDSGTGQLRYASCSAGEDGLASAAD